MAEKVFCSDGWNSFWRLVLGLCAGCFPSTFIPICIGYQVFESSDTIESVTIHEFLAGYIVGSLLFGLVRLNMALGTI
jgi:hypothetical protein